MDPEIVAVAEVQDFGERIDGAGGGGAHGDDYGADVAFCGEALFERVEIHACVCIDGDGFEIDFLRDAADAVVGVVSLLAGEDFFAGGELVCDPEGFEIGHRAAAGEMAEEILPAEHRGDFDDGFFFEGAAGGAATPSSA